MAGRREGVEVSREGVGEEEVRAGGERFKCPSHTAVNLPKTSSASRQGLTARPRGSVQGRGRRRFTGHGKYLKFRVWKPAFIRLI